MMIVELTQIRWASDGSQAPAEFRCNVMSDNELVAIRSACDTAQRMYAGTILDFKVRLAPTRHAAHVA